MAPPRLYRDRQDAGRKLGVELAAYFGLPHLLVLGLPRGGVPVAAAAAELLRAPLDVVAVRKVGLPSQPELAAGAMAWLAGTVTTVRNEPVLVDWQRALASRRGRDQHPPGRPFDADQAFDEAAAVELLELIRRDKLYRMQRDPLDVRGRTVIVVDDGLATGSTMRAALLALRRQEPARLIAAAPVACGSAGWLSSFADDAVVPWESSELASVGQTYESFDQTTDAQVRQLLDVP
ncbi:phosphoribosyltransferase [Arthrobacter sp. Z1-15]